MGTTSRRRRTLAMLAVVAPVAAAATTLTALLGRLDSALLFVGVPCPMALAIGLIDTDEDPGGQIFQVVTVVLLLVSAFLHEGALCVAIVSPLVYGVVYGVWGLVRLMKSPEERNQWHSVGLLLVVLVALEGAVPGLRINPEQSVTASDVVANECATFEQALERGPAFSDDDRGWLLKAAQYPLPTAARGDGLSPGDTWTFTMPAGSIETVVTDAAPGDVAFEVTADGARTTRWVTLDTARLTWAQTDTGCHASVTLDFTRDLDPAFWFGPVTEVFMQAGTHAFLAGLD